MAAPVPGRGPGPGVPPPAMPPPGARAGMPPGPPLGAPNASPQPGGYRPPPGAAPRPASAAVVVDGTNRRFDLRRGATSSAAAPTPICSCSTRASPAATSTVQFDGSFATVYDLGSTNGTTVNGHEVGSQVLRARRRHPSRAHAAGLPAGARVNSPLALQLMRFGFLALLWLFVLAAVRVVRSDLRSAGQPRVGLPPPARRRGTRRRLPPLRPLAADRPS